MAEITNTINLVVDKWYVGKRGGTRVRILSRFNLDKKVWVTFHERDGGTPYLRTAEEFMKQYETVDHNMVRGDLFTFDGEEDEFTFMYLGNEIVRMGEGPRANSAHVEIFNFKEYMSQNGESYNRITVQGNALHLLG